MLYTAQTLPVCQIALSDWQLVKISGADSRKYLQGQITANIEQLTPTQAIFAAHCDPKGKVWSNMILFQRGEDIYYIERKSVVEQQVNELKKYAIFSKLTIEVETELALISLAGDLTNWANLPEMAAEQNCVTTQNITFIKLEQPATRYFVIGSQADFSTLNLPNNSVELPNQQWQFLDMQAGFAIIDHAAMAQYLPQSFNLQNIGAIDFHKGCYCGQEMVARAQFRGINKRALYLLSGQSETLPNVGDALEMQLGENWRDTGFVLCALMVNDTVFVQAILNNDTDETHQFRVKNSHSHLALC